jgi:hypothetical protein
MHEIRFVLIVNWIPIGHNEVICTSKSSMNQESQHRAESKSIEVRNTKMHEIRFALIVHVIQKSRTKKIDPTALSRKRAPVPHSPLQDFPHRPLPVIAKPSISPPSPAIGSEVRKNKGWAQFGNEWNGNNTDRAMRKNSLGG